MFSQEAYYYHRGAKISVQTEPNKAVVIAPKGKSAKTLLSKSANLNSVKIITDTKSDITVLENNSRNSKSSYSATKSAIQQSINNENSIILPFYKSQEGEELPLTNYLYVKLVNESDFSKLSSVVSRYNLEVIEQNEHMPLWYTLSITSKTVNTTLEVANMIYESGNFAASYPDFAYDQRECSYDPGFSNQWALYNSVKPNVDISICSAWNYSTGRGIKIAIVDEGVDVSHRDLSPNAYYASYDTETKTSPARVYGNHGTFCAGIAAAARNNGLDVAGVAPDAKLMPVSFNYGSANGSAKLADGINWAWKNGADIISCSWNAGRSQLMEDAIDSAIFYGRNNKGAIFVKSAGNNGGNNMTYPGTYRPEILTVGAINIQGARASFSSYGSNLDIVAPGESVTSTTPYSPYYGSDSGTSFACPHASGVAALILERNPGLSRKQVTDIIEKNTKKLSGVNFNIRKDNGTWNEQYGYGLIDAYSAVINTPR